MKNKHQVHNLIILDESGSMESIKTLTINGFNEIVQTVKEVAQQFPEQEHFISMISFNGIGRKIHHWKDPIEALEHLNAKNYQPDANTPLFDAMGVSIGKMAAELSGEENYNVLVTIFTDGEENASVEFCGSLIKKMVEDLKNKNWTFSYIGTDHDVDKIAGSISINNVITFEKNAESMKAMFMKESKARFSYSDKISKKENTKDGYYDDKNSKCF
jgi:hypothetical protein